MGTTQKHDKIRPARTEGTVQTWNPACVTERLYLIIPFQAVEDLGVIAPVGELQERAAAGENSRGDLLGDFDVGVIEDGHHPRLGHFI